MVHDLQRVPVVLPPRGEYYDAEPFVGGGFVNPAALLKRAHEWTGGHDSEGAFTKEGKYGVQRTWNELETKHCQGHGRRNPIRDDDGLLK
jgi:hypothetical protein